MERRLIFLPRRQGRHFFLEQYTRALWLASFGATFKLDKVAEATIQSFDGAREKAILSGAASWSCCLVRILASRVKPMCSPAGLDLKLSRGALAFRASSVTKMCQDM